jgi:hypothetical protein
MAGAKRKGKILGKAALSIKFCDVTCSAVLQASSGFVLLDLPFGKFIWRS